MALNSLGLGFVFAAKDLATGTMTKLERRFGSLDRRSRDSLGRFQKTTSGFMRGFGLLAAGAIGVIGSLKIAKSAGEFGQGLAAVGAVTKATTAELHKLENAAIDAGIKTQFSPKEAVDGLTSLATAGQTAAEAVRTLNPVLDLAAGSLGQLGVAGAAEAVVGTLNAYGKSADDAAETTDKLLRITQLTNFQTRDFEAGLSKAAAAGAVFGTNLDDTLITIGQLRNANIDASSASTSFREATRRLFSDQNVQQKVQKAGIKLFDETTGKARSTVDVLLDMADKTENMTEKERGRFVAAALGARGLLSFNAIAKATFKKTMPDGTVQILKGRDAIVALRSELGNAEGTAQAFREALLDTFEGQKTLLKGTLETISIVAGKEFAQVLKPLVGGVVNALNQFILIIQATPGPVKRMVAGTILFASAMMGLSGALILAKLAFRLLRREAQRALIGMLPILHFVAIAGVAFLLFKRAYERNIGGFATFIDNVVKKVKLTLGALAELFTKGEITENAEALMDPANKSVLDFVELISVNMKRAEAFVDGFIEGVGDGLTAIEPVLEVVGELFMDLAEALSFNFKASEDLEGTLAGVRKIGAFIGRLLPILVTGWVAYKAVTIGVAAATNVVKVAMLAYRGVLMVVKGTQMAMAASSALMNTAILGPVGLLVAAAAAGVAFGMWLDETYGLSDGLQDLIGDITGLNAELDALDKAAGGRTKKRGAEFLATEVVAEQAGTSTKDFIDKRAKEIAQSESAKRKGLTEETIRARLAKGEDVFSGASKEAPKPATAAAGGAARAEGGREAARTARAEKGALSQEKMAKLQAQQLAELKKLAAKNPELKLNVDGRNFAEIVGKTQNEAAAGIFGGTPGFEGV